MSAKYLKICFCCVLAAIVAAGAILTAALVTKCVSGRREDPVYDESTDKVDNPDQGFYRPVYTEVTETEVKPNGNINSAARLLHLRMDISAFSSAAGGRDAPLTQAALDGLEALLADMRTREKNAVIRFAYAPKFGDMKDAEPPPDIMREHIRQACGIFNKYESVITAVEVGMIGPWGEMHSSKIADAAHISPLIEEYLTDTQGIAILVRTPKMIYDYLGIAGADAAEYAVPPEHKAYRLGLFNDGYLGSASDLGTFADRERDIAFLSRQNAHLPYGGEVTVPESTLHNIENCLPEMRRTGLSYLNIEWNDKVIEKWKNTKYTKKCGDDKQYYGKSAFTYIENRLGYRFVLKKSALDVRGGKARIELRLENAGFGNLLKQKRAEIIFADADGGAVYTQSVENFTGAERLSYEVNADLPAGEYTAYLRLFGDTLGGAPIYCVRFANSGLWHEAFKANKLGDVKI